MREVFIILSSAFNSFRLDVQLVQLKHTISQSYAGMQNII